MFVSLQLRPLSELVKEVQCAGMKKIYLGRAIEQYLTESDPCHCQPCRNNGVAFTDGDSCKCVCKPGTRGLACEHGAEAEGQQGEFGPFATPVLVPPGQHRRCFNSPRLFRVAPLLEGVIHGSWTCWSAWLRCSGAQRLRRRSCSNPTPQNGGQHCSGQSTQTSDCDEDELAYLKLVSLKALQSE